jgi:TPR repeat protein
MKPEVNFKTDYFSSSVDLYQSSNGDYEVIKQNFIVRKSEFQLIIDDLKNKLENDPLQHELILGRRGSGKSTLLKRIQIEIDQNPALSSRYISINLAEEQAGIYRLFDLWVEVLAELIIKLNLTLSISDYKIFRNDQAYARHLYALIHEILTAQRKKAVLLLDNIDRIIENFTDDGNLLRETLLNYSDLAIIGGSTRMDEHFWRYDQPFYEFFRRHRLEALSNEETYVLLNHWSESLGLPLLKEFVNANPGKIATVRILTDGLPRTLLFFIRILLQDSTLFGFDYLKRVIDEISPLYQERINSLPPPARKIVLEMAFLWEACSVKQLVEKCNMQSKLISVQLQRLAGLGLVEVINTSKKNHLYRLDERFFNMWLIVTQGNPEQKRKAKWLSVFLEAWYEPHQLRILAQGHIKELRSGNLPYGKAILLTKALSQVKAISTIDRDMMLDYIEDIAPPNSSSYYLELPSKAQYLISKVKQLYESGNYKQAILATEDIENENDGIKFFLLGFLYKKDGKFKDAEKYYLLAIERGTNAYFNLAYLYTQQGKLKEAEQCYKAAIELGNSKALNNLANVIAKQGRKDEAIQYYILAVEMGSAKAAFNLAEEYSARGETELAERYYSISSGLGHGTASFKLAKTCLNSQRIVEAEKYFLLAIEQGNQQALNDLGILYSGQGRLVEAEKFYLKAIEAGSDSALYNLGLISFRRNDTEKAKYYFSHAAEKGNVEAAFGVGVILAKENRFIDAIQFYQLAIEKGNVRAMVNLAFGYDNSGNSGMAEKYYLMAINANGDSQAKYNLALLYYSQGKFDEAIKYFSKAAQSGNEDALFCLGNSYVAQRKYDDAVKTYLDAIKKGKFEAMLNLANIYADQKRHEEAEKYYFLALEKGENKALFNLALMWYYNNVNAGAALDLIQKYNRETPDATAEQIEIVLEIWNNIFNNLQVRVYDLVTKFNEDETTSVFLRELLVQHQDQIVLNLFRDKDIGDLLSDQYALLYYAAMVLAGQPTSENLDLRIPPEVLLTVNEIVEEIRKKRIFYHGQ